MPETASRCSCAGCREPVVAFRHFPTVVGYCLAHGNLLANFLSQIDARGACSFDDSRMRWENIARRSGRI